MSDFYYAIGDFDLSEYAFGRQALATGVRKLGRMTGNRGLAKVLNTNVGTLAKQGAQGAKQKMRVTTASAGAMKRVNNIKKIRNTPSSQGTKKGRYTQGSPDAFEKLAATNPLVSNKLGRSAYQPIAVKTPSGQSVRLSPSKKQRKTLRNAAAASVLAGGAYAAGDIGG